MLIDYEYFKEMQNQRFKPKNISKEKNYQNNKKSSNLVDIWLKND